MMVQIILLAMGMTLFILLAIPVGILVAHATSAKLDKPLVKTNRY